MSGPLALVGSGEYLPVMDPVERALLTTARARRGGGRFGPGRFVQLATAAAPEGAASVARWHALGAAAAQRIGAEQVVVPVLDRAGADDPANAELVDGADLVYLSGGNPTFLTETLRDTAVWRAISAAWQGGAALAGCSAGAMALGGRVPHIRAPLADPIDGLGVVGGIEVLPHFDMLTRRFPQLLRGRLAGRDDPDGGDQVLLVGIDEDTALVSGLDDGTGHPIWNASWTVMGRQSVWLLDGSADGTGLGHREFPAGSTLTLGR